MHSKQAQCTECSELLKSGRTTQKALIRVAHLQLRYAVVGYFDHFIFTVWTSIARNLRWWASQNFIKTPKMPEEAIT